MDAIIDFERAKQDRDAGIAQSFDNAKASDDSWPSAAIGFPERFARTHEYFDAWEVTTEAAKLGYAPATTDKAWGAIFIKAVHRGLIEAWGMGRNPRRHASVCIRYRSLVYVGDVA